MLDFRDFFLQDIERIWNSSMHGENTDIENRLPVRYITLCGHRLPDTPAFFLVRHLQGTHLLRP